MGSALQQRHEPRVTVASPCRQICVMDAATGFCIGCGRTLAEIAAWSRLDDTGKRAILADLRRRLGEHADALSLSQAETRRAPRA